jgi:DNA-binding beta-propeller fold protein YncE
VGLASLWLLSFGCFSAAKTPAASPDAGVVSPGSIDGGVQRIALPDGAPGIGFDDLRFAPRLRRILVPAGRSGRLDLVAPDNAAVTSIGGFHAQPQFGGGHGSGTTSADEGNGLLFAIDRTDQTLKVVDPAGSGIVASAALGGSPDYVRYVALTNEVWVTEPDSENLEVFTMPASGTSTPAHAAFVSVPGGPESLVIDATRGLAYTHLWSGTSLAIDLRSRAITARWPNGCSGSRGIALDEPRGFLLVGCAEGKATVLDVRSGAMLGSASSGAGVDVIDYSPSLGHLYLPGATSATMAILGVSTTGALSVLGTVATASGAHCVAADDRGQAYVCDPNTGAILLYADPYAASPR